MTDMGQSDVRILVRWNAAQRRADSDCAMQQLPLFHPRPRTRCGARLPHAERDGESRGERDHVYPVRHRQSDRRDQQQRIAGQPCRRDEQGKRQWCIAYPPSPDRCDVLDPHSRLRHIRRRCHGLFAIDRLLMAQNDIARTRHNTDYLDAFSFSLSAYPSSRRLLGTATHMYHIADHGCGSRTLLAHIRLRNFGSILHERIVQR